MVHLYHISIHSFIYGQVGCFHIVAIVNEAVVNDGSADTSSVSYFFFPLSIHSGVKFCKLYYL